MMLAPCFATAAAPGFPAAEFGPASLAGFRPIMHRGGEGVPLACYNVLVKIFWSWHPWHLSLSLFLALVLSLCCVNILLALVQWG